MKSATGAGADDLESRLEDWWQEREREETWSSLQDGKAWSVSAETDYRPCICLADGLWRADRLAESQELGRRALERMPAEASVDSKWLGRGRLTLGIAMHSEGRHEEGLAMLREALRASRQAGELNDAAQATNNIGLLHRNAGAFGLALENLQLAARLFEESGDELGISKVWLNMALVLDRIGQKEKAVDLAFRARDKRKRLGNPYMEANANTNLAIVLEHAGHHAEAEAAFEEALAISTREGYGMEAAEALHGYAVFLEFQGKLDQAIDSCHRGLDKSTHGELPVQERKLLRTLAWILINQPAETERALSHARIRQILGSMDEEKDELLLLLDWLRNRTDPNGNPDYLAHIELQHARYWETRGNYEKAYEHLDLYRQYDNRIQEEQLRGQVSNLQVSFEVDQLVKEAQSARLRSQELEREKQELSEVLAELKATNDWQIQQLGKVAHDLKNPLGAIASLIELSKERAQSGSGREWEENLTLMEEATRHALGEVDDLLQSVQMRYARGTAEPVRFKVDTMLEPLMQLHENAAAAKSIRLVWESESDLWLETDRNRLRDIVNNLVSNAVKYSPPEAEVQVRAYTNGGHFVLEVADEGPGFSEADRGALFGMFQRLSAQPTGGESSTGLGLFITRQCVQSLQGSISLQPCKESGAHFRVELPRRLIVPGGKEAGGN